MKTNLCMSYRVAIMPSNGSGGIKASVDSSACTVRPIIL